MMMVVVSSLPPPLFLSVSRPASLPAWISHPQRCEEAEEGDMWGAALVMMVFPASEGEEPAVDVTVSFTKTSMMMKDEGGRRDVPVLTA